MADKSNTTYSKITLEVVVETENVAPIRRLLVEALDSIDDNDYTVFCHSMTDEVTDRPDNADDFEMDGGSSLN